MTSGKECAEGKSNKPTNRIDRKIAWSSPTITRLISASLSELGVNTPSIDANNAYS